jgi:hypothetical protein
MLQPGAMTKPTRKPARRGPGRPPAGRIKIMVSLSPNHVTELRREALRRAAAESSARPDVSALVREALDAWVAKRKG